jgi:Uma2 family endonuclease
MSTLAEQVEELPRLPTQDDLPYDDGMPMESQRHLLQMDLLLQGLEPWAAERDDVVVNGNQFLYFNTQHMRARDFRGPDVYVAVGVRPGERKSWVVWQEGKAPDVIIELLSESTVQIDKGVKKQVYRDQLRVPNYYWFDPYNAEDRAGFLLQGTRYLPLLPDAAGRLPVPSLGLNLGLWHGDYRGVTMDWLRWMDAQGNLLLLRQERALDQAQRAEQAAEVAQARALAETERAKAERERADAERERAEAETQRAALAKQRADAAEAELARLRAQLSDGR